MEKLTEYLRLMRPVNCVMMGFAVIVGAALTGAQSLGVSWQSLLYGFITGFTLTAASMTINDYYDREIDAINEPHRPIPSGLVKPNSAVMFASALTAIGFATAFFTSILCLLIALIAWGAFIMYTTVGKKSGFLGNLLVSTCVAIPFLYGSAAISNEIRLNVLIFASIAFLSNTGREITKGIVDLEGDKTRGVRTLAARSNQRTAAIVAALFYLLAVALSPIPWFLNLVSMWFIPLVAVTDLGIAASTIMLVSDYSRENAKKIKNLILVWFVFGLLAFILGAFGSTSG